MKRSATRTFRREAAPFAENSMFGSRPIWFYGLLIAALGGPYLLLDQNMAGRLWKKLPQLISSAEKKPAQEVSSPATEARPDPPLPLLAVTAPSGAPLCDIPDAFRFDVSPEWITARWPRVTTVLAETELQGLRVPLITGTRPDDLAGSLTYYFDKRHEVQRIAFQGTTGDEQRLVAFMTQIYGLKAVPTLGAGLYMTQAHGTPLSTLRLTWPPVVSMKQTSRCEIVLELNRPDAGPSRQVRELLEYDRRAKKW